MKKRRLYFRPRRPPKWWPRAGRIFQFVGVLDTHGWVQGEGPLMTAEGIAQAKEILRSDYPKCLFKVK